MLLCKELSKFKLKTNVILNELEKYMSLNVNNKLIFIDSLQFLSFSFKNLGKNDFNYWNH